MSPRIPLTLLLAATMLSACTKTKKDEQPTQTTTAAEPAMSYPETKREDVTDTLHGVQVADPYRWLEDVKSPDVQAWMSAQHDFTQAYLNDLPTRDWLTRRFTELYYIDAVGTPQRAGDRFFLYRRNAQQEKYVLYWKQGIDGEEKLLIDPNSWTNASLGGISPSDDGKYLAYKIQENNADEATLHVMEVETGADLKPDVIEGAKYAWPSWTPDNKAFYYTWLPTDESIPAMERPGFAEVRLHTLGSDPATDKIIIEKTGDPQKFIGASISREGKYLFNYEQRGWTSTDISYRPLDGKHEDTWVPIAKGLDAQFDATVWKDQLYIHTNWEAPNWRVLKVSMEDPTLEKATEIIPESSDAVLKNVSIIGGKLALTYMEKAHNQLKVHDLAGKHLHDVALPGIGASGGLSGEPDAEEAFFTFASFTTPNQIYQTNISTNETSLWASIQVPIDPSPYSVEQVFYDSKDGTKVSMFIVQRKDAPRDGSTPFILNGYGGFNVSMTPYFRASIYPWLEAGGGFAVANLRGGGEYGESWHKDGMLLKKQNVFDDFVAASEFLIQSKYTSKEKLAIRGGSNGGLLVGAAMTQRPDLFGAVICAVPLLDMVRYHLHGSGKTWVPEYGSAEDADQFAVLHAYSPYHRVTPKTDYPATLFLSADSDDRVDPLHARKMVAALQHVDTDGEPLLLRIEANAGHGGGGKVSKWVAQDVDTYSFLMKQLGVSAPE